MKDFQVGIYFGIIAVAQFFVTLLYESYNEGEMLMLHQCILLYIWYLLSFIMCLVELLYFFPEKNGFVFWV